MRFALDAANRSRPRLMQSYNNACIHPYLPQDFEVVRRIRKEEMAGGGEIRVLDQAALCAPRR